MPDIARQLFRKLLPHEVRHRVASLVPFSNTSRYHEVLSPPLKSIEGLLATPAFGREMSERCVEIPWALNKLQGARTVLEVGHANAEPVYINLLKSLKIPELHGLDLVNGPYDVFVQKVGDVRDPPYAEGTFDFVLCISTLEHVGQDNTAYGTATDRVGGNDGDMRAMRGLYRILKPGGRLIVTVPYGAPKDFGWQIQYDAARFDRLLAAAPFVQRTVEYFGYENGWKRVPRETLAQRIYGENAPNAAGLACAELQRPLTDGKA